ncbi:MAG TPA: alkaline phosphatase family protein [Acidimicrobiales bacterium]|nr:alkaline phosphatase family protein [Acidimicrobiales bacterium]
MTDVAPRVRLKTKEKVHRHMKQIAAAVLLTVILGAGPAGAASTTSTTAPLVSQPKRTCPANDVVGGPTGCYLIPPGIHKIKHVIILMQENRSFDSYFGTYPGTDGIPKVNGVPTVCVPDPHTKTCVAPFHDAYDINGGGPHGEYEAAADVNSGLMNGFVQTLIDESSTCKNPNDPACGAVNGNTSLPDVMGYHTAAEIPNYWTYANDYVLNDHMFEPVSSWSLPDHLYLVSGWSARCKNKSPTSCLSDIYGPYADNHFDEAVAKEMSTGTTTIDLAWTDLTRLLFRDHVSWGYYVQTGHQPDCANDSAQTCKPVPQSYTTPGIWNPLPLFTDVHANRQEKNIQPLDNFLQQAHQGTLPAVSWVTPSQPDSEHPPASVHQGQAYVTALINSIMKGPDWKSCAIFLSWDDWGGFYDGVVPPAVDQSGYGLRVPSLVISPYAKRGYIDHSVVSSDAYLKFIEDAFLSGSRLDPRTDGRPDPRPDVREDQAQLGNLANDFNFTQAPRSPVLLPTNPPSDSPDLSKYFKRASRCFGCTPPRSP